MEFAAWDFYLCVVLLGSSGNLSALGEARPHLQCTFCAMLITCLRGFFWSPLEARKQFLFPYCMTNEE